MGRHDSFPIYFHEEACEDHTVFFWFCSELEVIFESSSPYSSRLHINALLFSDPCCAKSRTPSENVNANTGTIVEIKTKMLESEIRSLPVVKLKGTVEEMTMRGLKKGVEGIVLK